VSFAVALPGARVLFSTREGGISEGAYESLNLGLLTGDDRERVIVNRERLAGMAGVDPQNVGMGWQVHGTEIREWQEPDPDRAFLDPQGGHLKVDGHIVRRSDMAALVLVADCLPVAIAGAGAVAMLHCGWRGLAGGIIGAAVERMGGSAAGLGAAVGPGIGPCCYEVGDEVLSAFAAYDDVADGRMLNLRAVAEAQLRAAGIEQIEHVDHCTSCRPDLFFSHRRDEGVTGRQGGIAWLTG
jgi:purine-nucleoside/S-methyl-5'-thioadenosine phosphorylase / adenosine deaminase